MREILFRGKRIDNGEWVTSNTFYQCNGEIKLWDEPNRDGYVEVIPETVGQYIGLTDKNGKKIFEGDIVHGYWNTKFLIFFDLCCLQFRAKLSDGTEKDIDYYGDSKKIEVIGNIYDNPELLRSENG